MSGNIDDEVSSGFRPNRTTIAIKSFNREQVFEAIDSVLAQTERCNLLVVDDGSNFLLQEKLAARLSGIPNGKLILLEENRGIGHLGNLIFDSATSKYLGFLDSDDLLHPEFVRKMELHMASNSWASFAYCRFVGGPAWFLEGKDIFGPTLRQGYLSALGTLFGELQAFRELKRLPTRDQIGEAADACDDDRLSFEIARCFGISHLPEELYVYRDGAKNRLTSSSSIILKAWSQVLSDYDEDYRVHAGDYWLGWHWARVHLQFVQSQRLSKTLKTAISGLPNQKSTLGKVGYLSFTLKFMSRLFVAQISATTKRRASFVRAAFAGLATKLLFLEKK